jgi:hypothetical protein
MSTTAALSDLGMDHLSSRALAALPLVEVAWADGSLGASEVDRIVHEAEASLGLGEEGALLLTDWLRHRPSDTYFAAGRALLREAAATPGSGIEAAMLRRVPDLAREVALAARGWMRFLGVRAREQAVIDRIAKELSALTDAPAERRASSHQPTMLAIGPAEDDDDHESLVGVVIVETAERRTKHLVTREGLVIGGSTEAHVVVAGEGVAAKHARVIERRRRFYVEALGTAPVLVRDEKVGQRRLLGGEPIRLGRSEVVFKMARRT